MASIGGISYQSQIDQLMQYYRYLEEEPIRRLEDQKSTLNSKLDIYNSLSTKLSSFKTVITDFTGVGSLSPLQEKTVEYSIENMIRLFQIRLLSRIPPWHLRLEQELIRLPSVMVQPAKRFQLQWMLRIPTKIL